MRASLVLIPLAFAACDPGTAQPPQESLARVQQSTIEDGMADSVFGQPDLTSATEPTSLSTDKLLRPSGLAGDVLMKRDAPPGLYWMADRGAHRVIGAQVGRTFASHLIGQFSWNTGQPNRGSSVAQGTLDSPSAVAFVTTSTSSFVGWFAIADTGNHRVVLGRATGASFPPMSVVLGQHGDFFRANPNDGGSVGADTLSAPRGVAFDDRRTGIETEYGHLYVADSGNHRVLRFGPGPMSPLIATHCLGQLDCERGAANGGGLPSAATLNDPSGIATWNPNPDDGTRGIWVADTGNHRVLHFRVLAVGAPSNEADRVIGQPDFTSVAPSNGGVTARSLHTPTAVAVAADGSLWVADSGHHRVLHFPKQATVADRVLGQPDFTTATPPSGPSATTLNQPTGVALTPDGSLVVADTLHARVLRYRVPCKVEECDDGNPCTDDTCDPELGCVSRTMTWPKACAPYRCDFPNKRCFEACQPTAGWCQNPYACIGTRCAITCGEGTVCPTGLTCADGFCCDAPCTGTCESCNQSGFYGACRPAPAGPPPFPRQCAVEVAGECGTACNGSQRKECVYQGSGTSCGHEACTADDDGDRATLRGKCDGVGACVSRQVACAPYTCSGGGCRTSCTVSEHCSEGAQCIESVCTNTPSRIRGGGCAVAVRGVGEPLAYTLLLAVVARLRRRR